MKLTPAQTKAMILFAKQLCAFTGTSEFRQFTAHSLAEKGLIRQQIESAREVWPYEVGRGGYVLTEAGREWLARNGHDDTLYRTLTDAAKKWDHGSRLWATDRPGSPANLDESRKQAERAAAFQVMASEVDEWASRS